MTTVDKDIDQFDANYEPRNEVDMIAWKSCESNNLLYSTDTDEYFCLSDDPQIYDGAHVSVQVVARRLEEEKVLALTEILASALRL